MVTVCPSQFATRRTLFHVLVGCGLLMLKVSRLKLPVIWLLVSMWLNTLTKSQIWTLLRSEERFSRNAETDVVCRLLLEKKKDDSWLWSPHYTTGAGVRSRYTTEIDMSREGSANNVCDPWLEYY